MRDMISFCGPDCGKCDVYLATIHDDQALREKTTKLWSELNHASILMNKLHLVDEDGYLIRAAMMAFYKDPKKWVTGSYTKIGYFGKSDSDLVYQDEVHGPLIEQVDKTVDLVYTKYLKALIDYEGIQRIE